MRLGYFDIRFYIYLFFFGAGIALLRWGLNLVFGPLVATVAVLALSFMAFMVMQNKFKEFMFKGGSQEVIYTHGEQTDTIFKLVVFAIFFFALAWPISIFMSYNDAMLISFFLTFILYYIVWFYSGHQMREEIDTKTRIHQKWVDSIPVDNASCASCRAKLLPDEDYCVECGFNNAKFRK